MPCTEWFSPSSNHIVMVNAHPWVNPANAYTQNDLYTTVQDTNVKNIESDVQAFTGWNITADKLPISADITRVEVQADMYTDIPTTDYLINCGLYDDTNGASPTNNLHILSAQADIDEYYPFEGTQLFGHISLGNTVHAVDVHKSTFGIYVKVVALIPTAYTVFIDHFRLRVFYSGDKASRLSSLHFQKHYEPTGLH